MNVLEMADMLASKHAMDKKTAKAVVESVFAAIKDSAVSGDEVSIPGFGKFKVSSREARSGRNPATGETIQIAASKKLGFTPAKQLKDSMNTPSGAKAKPKAKK
jgi:DNA-binding protein HU-beta